MFETCFCAGFCRFLRRIAALLCDKNGQKDAGMMPQRTFEKILNSFLI